MFFQLVKSGLFALLNQAFPLLVIIFVGFHKAENYNIAVVICNYVYQLMTPTLIYAARSLPLDFRRRLSNGFGVGFIVLTVPAILLLKLPTEELLVVTIIMLLSIACSDLAMRLYVLEAQLGKVTNAAKVEILAGITHLVVAVLAVVYGESLLLAFSIGFLCRYVILFLLL